MQFRSAVPAAILVVWLLALMVAAAACGTTAEEMPVASLDEAALFHSTSTETATAERTEPGVPDGPLVDMARLDGPAVQGYARKYGVTPEQAAEIIKWQAAVNEQLGLVISIAGPRYAGARFLPPEENDGEAVVEIYIADPTEEDVAAVARLDGARLVEAIGGMEEIERIAAEAVAIEQEKYPGARVSAKVDPASGEVEIFVDDFPVLDD